MVEPKADKTMGVVLGSFVPFAAYERVKPVFRLFAEAYPALNSPSNHEEIERFCRERDALGLSIMTTTGVSVATLAILIYDFAADLGEDGYEAEFYVDYLDGTFFSQITLWDDN